MCAENIGVWIQKMKFGDIFFLLLCQNEVNFGHISYFYCIFYLFSGSCSLKTFEKIVTFICQSQKQNSAFRLDNFWFCKLFRLNGEK